MADSEESRTAITSSVWETVSWLRTRRDNLPPVQPVVPRPEPPDFTSIMTDTRSETDPTVDEARLEEKMKQFEQEEMERREQFEKQQQKDGQISNVIADSPPRKFTDKRKKNLIFDEESFADTFLKCVVCQESFNLADKIPKMLPCHHTFCMDCLCQMWRVEGEFRQTLTSAFRGMPMAVKIQCPTCRDGLITSEAEVRRLPNDHTILELLTFMKDTKRSDVQYCTKHHTQPLNFFCEPCIAPVCSDCTVLDHKESKGHVVVNVNEAMDKYTPIIESTLKEITEEKEKLDENKQTIIKAAQKLDNIQKDVNCKVKTIFEKLREAIDERERELYDQTEREVGRKRENLEEGLKELVGREELLRKEMKSLTNAKDEKDIGYMFSGHKSARELLAQKLPVIEDKTETFNVEFECDDETEKGLLDKVLNLADIVIQD